MLILLAVLCMAAAAFLFWFLVLRKKKDARGHLFDEEGASRSLSGSVGGGGIVQTSQTFSALATPVPVVQAVAAEG